MAEGRLKQYWKIIAIPTYILVGWNVLGLIVAAISYSGYMSVFGGYASWILVAVVFGFIGYSSLKDYKLAVWEGVKAGAFAGVIAGFVGGILGIFMMWFFPFVIEQQLQQVAGASRAQLEGMVKIGVYLGVITGPIINAVVGSIFAALGGLIGKKF